MTVIAPRCPKCGATMIGPRYNKTLDRLDYVCACGYSDSRPPLDSSRVPHRPIAPTGGYRTNLDLYIEAEDRDEVEHVIAGMQGCYDYNNPHLARRSDIVELPEDDELRHF